MCSVRQKSLKLRSPTPGGNGMNFNNLSILFPAFCRSPNIYSVPNTVEKSEELPEQAARGAPVPGGSYLASGHITHFVNGFYQSHFLCVSRCAFSIILCF
jgi:hypothetical protein